MLRSKLRLILPLAAVLVAAGLYLTVFSKSGAQTPAKVHGEVYVLPKEFIVNLRDGRYAKITVGLILREGALAAAGGPAEGTPPPEGFGSLPQEALVRDLVTEELTGAAQQDLISRAGRQRVRRRLLRAITDHTDVPAERVLLTDVAVQ
jgi:flagellar FliL protein